ncbi:MAG: hypothetical protein ABFS56_02515 [Pseudomonadota bacterium]
MLAVVQKCGNSQGLSFSKDILNKAQLSIGDEVFVTDTFSLTNVAIH